jgi:alkylhydroperoxidase family enzyme
VTAGDHVEPRVTVMSTTPPMRIPPLTDPDSDVAAFIERAGLRGPDGTPLNIFGTLANHPDLLRRWMVLAGHVMAKNSLPPRDREILILRTGVRCASVYEFSQHAEIALDCDMTADEVAALREAPSAHPWTDHDRALIVAADELHDDHRIGDATWAALSRAYDTRQMIDVVFTVGQYTLVSMFLNTAGVELDAGVADALTGR